MEENETLDLVGQLLDIANRVDLIADAVDSVRMQHPVHSLVVVPQELNTPPRLYALMNDGRLLFRWALDGLPNAENTEWVEVPSPCDDIPAQG